MRHSLGQIDRAAGQIRHHVRRQRRPDDQRTVLHVRVATTVCVPLELAVAAAVHRVLVLPQVHVEVVELLVEDQLVGAQAPGRRISSAGRRQRRIALGGGFGGCQQHHNGHGGQKLDTLHFRCSVRPHWKTLV